MEWLLNILQEMGTTLRLPTSFVVIEFIGTFAFALSGIRLASAKQFDVFGAWIVGMSTAIGGKDYHQGDRISEDEYEDLPADYKSETY